MTLRLPAGHRLLRLTALTPANCGESAGTAAVDRPVARDAWHDLPYLPSSAVKGVLAGRRGNASARNGDRATVFGAPDDDLAAGGRPARIVFGDGEPLGFPVVLRQGRRGWVAVAATIHRLAGLGMIEAPGLRRIERPNGYEAFDADGLVPAVRLPLAADRFGLAAGLLRSLLGLADGVPVVLAAPEAATALWLEAVERRTLTALGDDGVVRSGSLRSVELLPAGSVFVSLASNLTSEEVDLGPASPLQLGAWEGVGLGYFEAEVLGKPVRAVAREVSTSGEGAPLPQPSAPHEVMRRVFEAMAVLRERPEASRVRSAIFDLGPRLRIRGVPATLAFCLAKAGGGESGEGVGTAPRRESRERLAYRWLLGEFFGRSAAPSITELRAAVVAVIGGDQGLPADFEAVRLWLRRYAETMLPREKTDA